MGGGSLGAVQAGMLQALYERDIVPEHVVGSSVGAINAGFVAAHPPHAETARELGEIWAELGTLDVFPFQLMRATFALTGLRNYLVSSQELRRLIERHLPFDRLQDADVALTIVATDLMSGRSLALSEGPAVDAVLASASLPGMFPPVAWGGRPLVDGSFGTQSSLQVALRSGAQRVYALPTGSACALPYPPRGALGVLMHAQSLQVMQRLAGEVQQHDGPPQLVVLPPPCPLEVAPSDFGAGRSLVERGRASAHRALDALEAAGELAVPALEPHDHPAP